LNFSRTDLQIFDPELLREAVKGSSLEHVQIDGGKFRGNLVRIELPVLCIDYGCYNLGIFAQGSLPQDRHTFGFLLENPPRSILNKCDLATRDLVYLPPGSTLDVTLSPCARWCTLSFERRTFERSLALHSGRKTLPVNRRSCSWSLDQPELSRLHRIIHTLLDEEPRLLIGPGNKQANLELQDALLEFCARALVGRELGWQRESRSDSTYQRLVRKVEAFVCHQKCPPGRIAEICSALNVTVRTLEYAFKSTYGIPPKRFLQIRRLHHIRKVMLQDESPRTVTAYAMAVGFWHLSQFAVDYRRQFGESPSDTLFRKIRQPNS